MKLPPPLPLSASLASIARDYAWTVPVVAAMGFLASALEGVGIGLLIPLFATLMSSAEVSDLGRFAFIDSLLSRFSPGTKLYLLSGAVLFLIVVKNVVLQVSAAFTSYIDGCASHRIRSALAERLLLVGYPFFLREQPARLINIITTESWRASEAIRALFAAVGSIGSILIFGMLMLVVDWRLTLIVGGGMILIRMVRLRMSRRLVGLSERMTECNERLADRMVLCVMAMRLIRVFGQQMREHERFDRVSDELRRIMYSIELRTSCSGPIHEILQAALFIALIVGVSALETSPNIPVLLGFFVLLQRLQPHLSTFEGSRIRLLAATGSVREVEWLLEPAGQPEEPTGRLELDRFRRAIRFECVDYAYNVVEKDAPAALRNVCFEIVAGKATAIIGASGSGKSTIINLICRLIEPTNGSIVVDDIPLREMEVSSWRSKIALAGQDIELVQGTVAENIKYGASDISDAEMIAAARDADAQGFIATLPNGYETQVGSRGLNLSGGQRQRIGLARALARKPEILILDEATNSVDGLSEAAIVDMIHATDRAMTTIVVSHRASALAACEVGIVMLEGQVVEAGPLASLRGYQRMAGLSLTS